MDLKYFFDQLYLAAWSFKHNEQMINYMKKLIMFICYLLALLNNMKINSFKFNLRFYLDSIGISNEGLNIITNLKASIMSRSIDHKKKRISNLYEKYVEKALVKYSENSFVLNINDYYNIHV